MLRTVLAVALLAVAPLGNAALQPGSPTVLITGANRGIGFELARQYAEGGWNVIATTRRAIDDAGVGDLRNLAAKHPKLVIERIDVTDTQMIRQVAAKYDDQPIDVLINNAAKMEETMAAEQVLLRTPYDKIDFDAARTDFDVNTLGPMRMVQAFAPHVIRSEQKKIVNITSLIGSFGRSFGGAMAMNYGASKAALNKYSMMLASAMQDQGVIVALVQPAGVVATKQDMQDMPRAAPVDEASGKLIDLIDKMTIAHSGKITNFATGETDPF